MKSRAPKSLGGGIGPRQRAAVAPAAYVGTWQVRRKVVDHRGATLAVFTGRATIKRTRFEETGQLTLGSRVLNATRAYRLRLGKHSAAVKYPDGSAFITLAAQPAQTVRHRCGADRYVGRFFFIDQNHWVEAWRVSGPRKRYASLSRYRRLAV